MLCHLLRGRFKYTCQVALGSEVGGKGFSVGSWSCDFGLYISLTFVNVQITMFLLLFFL